MMSVAHWEVLVEEPSIEAFLRLILPKIVGETSFAIRPHQCKNELLQQLPSRLRGYANWLPADWRIVVVVDRDNDDCKVLKQELNQMAATAGLSTRSKTHERSFKVVNRLAIEELEAWYFGDWNAVRTAYPKVPATIPAQAKYRDPDAIKGGTWEAFERLLQRAGYFKRGLRKIEVARAVGLHMVPDRNRSASFTAFRDAFKITTSA